MSVQQFPEAFITEEEYIRRERDAEFKSEYYNGRIYAMAGAAPPHNVLSGNTIIEVGVRLRGRFCIVYTSDQRVRVEASGLNTYPDVSVVCGESKFADTDDNALVNPMLIVEVMSPSTANYDRTTKFDHYKTMPSFTDYVLIHSDRIRVEHFARSERNEWAYQVSTHREEEFAISNLGIMLSIAELYRNLDLPELNFLHGPTETRAPLKGEPQS